MASTLWDALYIVLNIWLVKPAFYCRQAILKLTEPDLNPEMKASDYTVHFPHQSNRESTVKDFKVSGPVSPDSIRYQ